MFLWPIALALAGASEGGLELRLEPLKSVVQPGESPVMRVVVRNPRSEPDAWYLKRGFWLVPYSMPMDGDLRLFISVTDAAGRPLSGTTMRMMVVRVKTVPSMFEPLLSGRLFGEELALDDERLGFNLKVPGVYAVSAVLSSDARAWFDQLSEREKRESGLDRAKLFAGPIHAPSVEVRVVP